MNILFVMARMRGGGAERVVSELANCLAQKGNYVSIATMIAGGCVYDLDEQVNLIDFSSKNRGMIGRIKTLHSHFKKCKYDIVISFLTSTNIECIIAKLFTGQKLIISERNNPYVDPKGKIYRFLRKMTYFMSDGYVFQTFDAQKYFSKKIQKKSVVIMNPINPELPIPFDGERTKRIVNVGRLFEQKNHNMFIDAFMQFDNQIPGYVAEIYGDGPLEDELKSYISNVGMEGKVILRGFSDKVLEDINSAAIFAMSSDFEGMSNALIEAVGMGIPSISTDHPIGGARMIIDNGENGFLVPVGDSKQMAEKMIEIVLDNDKAKKLSKNGVALREKLSVRVIAEQWIEYAKVVIGGLS